MLAGASEANLTKIADVETAITPITTAMYGLNGGKRKVYSPLSIVTFHYKHLAVYLTEK